MWVSPRSWSQESDVPAPARVADWTARPAIDDGGHYAQPKYPVIEKITPRRLKQVLVMETGGNWVSQRLDVPGEMLSGDRAQLTLAAREFQTLGSHFGRQSLALPEHKG